MEQKNTRKYYCLALLALTPITLQAELTKKIKSPEAPKTTLALPDLIAQAMQQSPQLAAQEQVIMAAELKARRLRLPEDPKFTYQSKDNEHLWQDAFKRERRYGISQKVLFPGKLRLKRDIQLQEVEIKITQESAQLQKIVLESKTIYHKVYLNKYIQNKISANKVLIETLIKQAKLPKKTDLLDAKISLEELQSTLFGLKQEQTSLEAQVRALVNTAPFGDTINISIPEKIKSNYKKLAQPDIETIEKVAINSRTDVHHTYAEIEQYKLKAKLARRDYFPDFDLSFILQRKKDLDRYAWYVKAGFNIPIWARVKQKRESDEHEALAASKALELQHMRNTILCKLRAIIGEIQTVEQEIESYKTVIIPARQEIVNIQQWDFDSGKQTINKLIDAIRKLERAEISFEKAQINRELLFAKLEHEIGTSLETIL